MRPKSDRLLEGRFADNDPGLADFSPTGGEQDALAEYLQVFHPDADTAYDVPPDVNERMISIGDRHRHDSQAPRRRNGRGVFARGYTERRPPETADRRS